MLQGGGGGESGLDLFNIFYEWLYSDGVRPMVVTNLCKYVFCILSLTFCYIRLNEI